MSEDNLVVHDSVGLPDNHVDNNNEKIVYEYDSNQQFVGWHKESIIVEKE